MGEDPSTIRNEIAATRDRMGDTIDALGDKADVTGRAKQSVSDAVGTVTERLPDTGDVRRATRRAADTAQENPLGLAIGALAVGFLAGLAVPASRVEEEKLGPIADQVREAGSEAVEHGKDVAQAAAQAAAETARTEAPEHVHDVVDHARERAGAR